MSKDFLQPTEFSGERSSSSARDRVNPFKWWRLTLPALLLEAWLGFALWFAPGWANGWPFGLTIHTVWSAGMAAIASVMLMTLAAGVGAAACSLLLRHDVEPRHLRRAYRAWLVVWSVAVAIVGILAYRDMYAETLDMWPGGYNP